ncbi:hypothetical protein ABDB92_004717 [Escherichia coli O13/O135:H23]|uniref:hypothetical protein n=1 Tax=Escherichia coli TaxID=562 RepID=UPI001815471A|nr:hypothetical protein [Escherichia coli]EFB1475336.1 hypothetical protein [Escherichia coli]
MYRVNHIMRTINEMSSYTPHMKVNRITERLDKLQKISFCISILSFFLLAVIALTYGPFDTKSNLSFISVSSLYFINIIVGVTYLSVPVFNIVKYIYNLKGEVINELIYDIDSDEQHIEVLLPYSLEELTYASNCIQVRIPKIKSKCFLWGGGKTAIISILCLSYYIICHFNGGAQEGIFIGVVGDQIIITAMLFILYTSLMNMFFKQKALYLQNLKMIIDMTIKIKRNFT